MIPDSKEAQILPLPFFTCISTHPSFVRHRGLPKGVIHSDSIYILNIKTLLGLQKMNEL